VSNITDFIRQAMRLAETGRVTDAISSLRSLLTAHGNDADLHHSIGLLQFQTGAAEQALFHFDKARRLEPDRADMLSDYATALNITGKADEATDVFRKAVAIDPRTFPAQLGLSSALIGVQDYDGAVAAARIACELATSRPEPWVNLGLALVRSGRSAEAITTWRDALKIMPDQPMILANLCNVLNNRHDVEPTEIFQEHTRLGRALVAAYGGGIRSFNNDASPNRPLRIGYLSAFFKEGPIPALLSPVLAAHDRDGFRPVCFSVTTIPDESTQRLRTAAGEWRDVSRFNEGTIAQQIAADRIDILVEIGGHAPGSRMGPMVVRGAPVQVSWLGYPSTTGLKSIGYRISDTTAAPDADDAVNTEKLVRLNGTFLCFAPSNSAPPVSPRDSKAAITFGSFNPVHKLSEAATDTWAAILRGLPGSALTLKAGSFADDATAARIRERFAGLGVSADRVRCLPHTRTEAEHLAAYGDIDIALDPFPNNGTSTTCEALDMGVPVVVLLGRTHAGRTGASILKSAGMDDCIASSTEDYIRIATTLAKDTTGLASLRTGLRASFRNSPVCNAAAFTRKLEAAYREMWRSWCSNLMYT
jgi:protein O-GlcNAc transferase